MLFDVDGTIIDSFPGIREGFLIGLGEVGWDIPDEEFIRRIPGPPMRETMATLGMDPATVERAMRAYSDFMSDEGWQKFGVFEGVPEVVAKLRRDGFGVCTATSKTEKFARLALERIGVWEHVEFFGAATADGTRSKKVDVIRYVMDHVHPARPIMVGDREHDFDGAATFDIPAVAVTWGYGTEDEWDKARWRANDAAELERIIREY